MPTLRVCMFVSQFLDNSAFPVPPQSYISSSSTIIHFQYLNNSTFPVPQQSYISSSSTIIHLQFLNNNAFAVPQQSYISSSSTIVHFQFLNNGKLCLPPGFYHVHPSTVPLRTQDKNLNDKFFTMKLLTDVCLWRNKNSNIAGISTCFCLTELCRCSLTLPYKHRKSMC